MMLKKTVLTLALSLGFVAAAGATTTDYGIITVGNSFGQANVQVAPGSFSDIYKFTIDTPLWSGGTASTINNALFYHIDVSGGVNTFSVVLHYGNGNVLFDLKNSPDSSLSSLTGSGVYAAGDYFFEVKGLATGTLGGQYNFGVNTAAVAVPEPETYAMLLAGLGLMGTIARRRKSKAA